jgi:hypothetical protein
VIGWPWKTRSVRRAERLLRANLNAQQRGDLEDHGYFFVTGGQSRLPYRVGPGQAVWLLAPGVWSKPAGTFCVYPLVRLPAADVMLAHALWIQHDERSFCSVAVFYPYSPDLWYGIIPMLREANLLRGTNYESCCYRRGVFAYHPTEHERL